MRQPGRPPGGGLISCRGAPAQVACLFLAALLAAIAAARTAQAAECASGSANGGKLVSVSSGACTVTSATNPNWVISSSTAVVTINGVTMNVPFLTPPTIPAGVTAQSGGNVTFEGSTTTISTNSGGATLLLANGPGSTITAEADNVALSAPNGGATAAIAENGGTITLNEGTSLNLLGGGGNDGLLATGAGSSIVTNNVTITAGTSGGNDFAARATQGAAVQMTNSTINVTASGGGTKALQADGAGSTLSATGTTVNFVGGDASIGAAALTGGQVFLSGGSIALSGSGGGKTGLFANAGTLTANGTATNVAGTGNDIGAEASGGGMLALDGGSVSATGTSSNERALLATGAGSTIMTTGGVAVSVPTSSNGVGAQAAASGRIALGPGAIVSTGGSNAIGLQATGSFSAITAPDGGVSITTLGAGAAAIDANSGGSVSLGSATIMTQGAGAPGGTVENGGALAIGGGDVTASGAGSPGFLIQSGAGTNTLQLTGTTVTSAADSFQVHGAVANITVNGSTATANNGSLLSTQPTSVVTFAAGNSRLAGAITTDAASTNAVTLSNATIWTVTGSSNMTTLVNNASLIAFTPPVNGAFKTVSVSGNYAGRAGQIQINTFLNAGGPLSNQFTDRLLIQGNATGTTTVEVHNADGPGDITSFTGIPDPGDGISIVQVAGDPAPNNFSLPGGYVTGGTPFAYRLNAYGPGFPNGPADPTQSLVGNPGGFADYRLQSAYVDPGGTIPPLEETPEVTAPEPPVEPGSPDIPGEPAPPPTEEPSEPTVDVPSLPSDARPEVAPQVPAYISTPRALFETGFLDIDSLHRRLGEIRDEQTLDYDPTIETFVRAYGGWLNYTSNRSFTSFGYNFKEDYGALQFGASRILYTDGNGALRIGLAGTLGRLWVRPSAIDGNSNALFNTETLAGIATWQAYSGWYLDGIVNGGLFDGRYTTPQRGQTLGMNGTSVAASIEGGKPFPLPWWQLSIEPQAQFVWQHLNFANRTDVDGIDVNMGNPNQGLMRLGFRLKRPFLTGDGMLFTPYLKANLLQGIGGSSDVVLDGIPFGTGTAGTALQVGGGATGTLTRHLAFYGDAAWQSRVSAGGFRGWVFNAGLRYDFGNPPPVAAALPASAPAPVLERSYLVFFDWDQATLTARARMIIAEAAQDASRARDTSLTVNGYTDTSGTARYNLALSVRRARAVEVELVRDGVPSDEITIHGFGDTNLLVPTQPGVREPQNRRVEIFVQ